MAKNTLITICLFLFGMLCSQAQEVLSPLQSNPVKTQKEVTPVSKDEAAASVILPFFDDFSYPGPYPDNALWLDDFVFINSSFAVHPKTWGTATFDAINQHGKIYPQADQNPYQFEADLLTSRPLRLDSVFSPVAMALSPSDSIMLSFFYQPQGHGSSPRQKDSLVVEFLHTPGHYTENPSEPNEQIWIDDLWVSIWRAGGENLKSFLQSNDSTYFEFVSIPITDEIYLREDFQFRFKNYASFPQIKTPINYGGNTSIWNIDYVLLDYGRTRADSFYYDIAFAAPAQSALNDLQAMPWSHYIVDPQSRHRSSFDVDIANLDDVTYNYSYRYFIRDENDNIVRNYSGGTWNIGPYSEMGFQSYLPHANPPLLPNPFGTTLTPAEARVFRIYHALSEGTTGDDHTRNDTLVYRQVFDNYFAYDDGIPENGYGLIGYNSRGAVRFILGHSDQLDAVEFFFNSTLNNQNQKSFIIKVWKNLDPLELLYESEVHTVDYGKWLNQFVSYPIDPPLEVSDTIYVGWQQLSDDFLNIGFDASNNAAQHIFYNTTGVWEPSIFSGSLMIRPVFGPDNIVNTEQPLTSESFTVYPNPLRNDLLTIQKPQSLFADFEIAIFDLTAKQVASFTNQTQLDLSALKDGMYFIRLNPTDGSKTFTSRFIIAR